MDVAEELVDPRKDSIYDGVFMVTTCPVDPRWFLHSFNIESFLGRSGLHVRDLLAENPPSIVIPNYRTAWLSEADQEFIRQRYLPLADDFWVLGKVLPSSGGEFEIYHAGRYHIAPEAESNLAITNVGKQNLVGRVGPQVPFKAVLDGQPLTNRTVELSVGRHRLETTAEFTPAVVWAGPRLEQAPPLEPGRPERLFVNWY